VPVAIGVDVGGTKTRIRISRGPGAPVDVVLPTSQWWAPGTAIDAPGNSERLVAQFHLDRLPADDQERATVFGAHGIDSQLAADHMRDQLARLIGGQVRVVNDAVLIGPAAGYLHSSIAVVAGTGSIVVSTDDAGRVRRRGGYGHLLGDEGSAPALVRDVARGVLRSQDLGQLDGVALGELADQIGLPQGADRAHDLAAILHTHCSRTDWGDLAPAVFRAADAGSSVASRVIGDHARQLADLVSLFIADGQRPEAVVLAGGVIVHQPRLANGVRDAIHERHAHLPGLFLKEPPVAGALALAVLTAQGSTPPTSAHSSSMRHASTAPTPLPTKRSLKGA